MDESEHAKKKLWKCQNFGMNPLPPQLWNFTTFFVRMNPSLSKCPICYSISPLLLLDNNRWAVGSNSDDVRLATSSTTDKVPPSDSSLQWYFNKDTSTESETSGGSGIKGHAGSLESTDCVNVRNFGTRKFNRNVPSNVFSKFGLTNRTLHFLPNVSFNWKQHLHCVIIQFNSW